MKTVRVMFDFPGSGVIFRPPPSTGANDSAQTPMSLELRPGLNTVPEAAIKFWRGRLRGVKFQKSGDLWTLSSDEQPLTPELLKQRRAQLERERIALERDQLALDRERLAAKKQRR